MDSDRAKIVHEEALLLFRIRNEALERVEAGDERAVPRLKAVTELLVERYQGSEEALRFLPPSPDQSR